MSSKSSIQNIFKLSIPIFFANLVIPFVAIVDTGLMGNLDNASYLVATSIAASVFSILFGSFGFLRSGTVGMIAQADGSKDCLLYTSPSPRDLGKSRMPSSA